MMEGVGGGAVTCTPLMQPPVPCMGVCLMQTRAFAAAAAAAKADKVGAGVLMGRAQRGDRARIYVRGGIAHAAPDQPVVCNVR